MTKFKVGDKVRVIDVSKICGGSSDYYDGMETQVVSFYEIHGKKHPQLLDKRGGVGISIRRKELDTIELITPKQTKSQRIAALEAEVQRLHERLADLEGDKATEVKAPKPALTPNEQRKAIIAEAKAFVEKYSGIVRNNTTPYTRKAGDTSVKLFVNEKKRAVAAIPHLVHVGTDFPEDKAIAKAHPDDVFNADIGKAIALGRALGLDVTRFEKAVQPTEVVVGMITRGEVSGDIYEVKAFHPDERLDGKYGRAIATDGIENIAWVGTKQVVIIDDTEAEY